MPDPLSVAPAAPPLIPSRSLGRLLGLESLGFRAECWQPTGSWLDRSAAALVAAAVAEGRTGLCTVGLDAWTLPLAIRCARAGLRLVVLEATAAEGAAPAQPEERGWRSALGVRTVSVEADVQALRAAAPSVADGAGLRLVAPGDPLLHAGLATIVQEVDSDGGADLLLVVPGLTGDEARWLAAAARRPSAAVPLPLDDVPAAATTRPWAIVATLGSTVPDEAEGDDGGSVGPDAAPVLAIAVSVREADAARRLLAREEGLLVSRRGGAGLAGLVRALRADRARRPRERRLRGVTSAVVVVTGDPLRAGDAPPPEPDAVPSRPVSLASLAADLDRLLVAPPGR